MSAFQFKYELHILSKSHDWLSLAHLGSHRPCEMGLMDFSWNLRMQFKSATGASEPVMKVCARKTDYSKENLD